MANDFKYTEIPPFTRRDGNALLYNGKGSLEYYIPEQYFERGSAVREGSYVRLIGSFLYRLVSENGTEGKFKGFNWPTVFLCAPSDVTKVKDVKTNEFQDPTDYRVLTFEDGDQLVTDVFTPQNIDNTKEFLQLHIMTGKVPTTIPYQDLYKYLYESMELNGSSFDTHSQAMGLIYSKICRDPDDPHKPFRLSKALDKDPRSYKTMSIKDAARYISPFASIISENFDEGVMTSVLLSDDIKEGKRKNTNSPLEQVLTM